MYKYILGIFYLVVKECCTSMLIKEMDISQLMTYSQKIKGKNLKERRAKEPKRAHFYGEFSNSRSEGGNGHLPWGKRSNQRGCKDWMTNPRSNMCGKNHVGRFLIDLGTYFGCGQMDHKYTNCPDAAKRGQEGRPQGQIVQGGKGQARARQANAP